jgi:hypothetical protein
MVEACTKKKERKRERNGKSVMDRVYDLFETTGPM